MLNYKLENGSKFVIFDLEWNQPIPGYHYDFDSSELTGEIIEIGASKYELRDGLLERIDVLSLSIRPVIYTKLNYQVRKLIGKHDCDLRFGETLKEAYDEFCEFIEDSLLVSWGNSDADMLIMNLKFFGLDYELKHYVLDLQPIFSLIEGEKGVQRSVEYAVDYYEIDKSSDFHDAMSDADYTGKIMEALFLRNDSSEVIELIEKYSINPDIKAEYKVRGGACERANEALSFISGFGELCPACKGVLKPVSNPFTIRKSTYMMSTCEKHGAFFGRIRVKKNRYGLYYASGILRAATPRDYLLFESKQIEYDEGINIKEK